jgi:deoxyribodipyrimidine photo-lyase
MTVIFWFRRDLRVQDNEALLAAVTRANSEKTKLAAAYVFGAGFDQLSSVRRNSLITSVSSLSQSLPSGISLASGDAGKTLLELSQKLEATVVYATRSFDTHGMLEQSAVAEQLYVQGISLQLVGSNYAVEPGTVRKDDDTPLKVYTPFYKRWFGHIGQRPFQVEVNSIEWVPGSGDLPTLSPDCKMPIKASESFALETWHKFKKRALSDYSENRNRTDLS